MQKKSISTLALTGALTALLLACLVMVFGWWDGSHIQFQWGGRPTNHMDAARNADTSNFDNVLKF
jgi:hypothetical protein